MKNRRIRALHVAEGKTLRAAPVDAPRPRWCNPVVAALVMGTGSLITRPGVMFGPSGASFYDFRV